LQACGLAWHCEHIPDAALPLLEPVDVQLFSRPWAARAEVFCVGRQTVGKLLIPLGSCAKQSPFVWVCQRRSEPLVARRVIAARANVSGIDGDAWYRVSTKMLPVGQDATFIRIRQLRCVSSYVTLQHSPTHSRTLSIAGDVF
jgi:hypothetical protein